MATGRFINLYWKISRMDATGGNMGEDKLKRRRFLADLLFAGGALTAAALVADQALRAKRPEPPHVQGAAVPTRATETPCVPEASCSPSVPTEKPMAPGQMKAPRQRPIVEGEPAPPRAIREAPPRRLKGDAAWPQPRK